MQLSDLQPSRADRPIICAICGQHRSELKLLLQEKRAGDGLSSRPTRAPTTLINLVDANVARGVDRHADFGLSTPRTAHATEPSAALLTTFTFL